MSARAGQCRLVPDLPSEQVLCDVGDLDLVGAGVDLQDLGVAGELFDPVLAHVAVAAEKLHGFERDLGRGRAE